MFPLEPAGVTVKVYVVPLPDNVPAVPPLTVTSPLAKSATASEKVNVNTTSPVAVPDVLSVMVSVGATRSRVGILASYTFGPPTPVLAVTRNVTGPLANDLISTAGNETLQPPPASILPEAVTVVAPEFAVTLTAVPAVSPLEPETVKLGVISAAEIISSVAIFSIVIVKVLGFPFTNERVSVTDCTIFPAVSVVGL